MFESLEPRLLLSALYPDFQGAAAPAADPALPGGMDVYAPPVDPAQSPPPGAPTFAAWSEIAGPGDVLSATGIDWSSLTGDRFGADTRFRVFGQTGASDDALLDAGIVELDSYEVVMVLDDSLPDDSMYLVWAENASGVSYPIAINQTDAWWNTARGVAGETVSVYGKNLSYYDGAYTGTNTSWVYLQPTAGGTGTWATVTDANPYKVDYEIPAGLGDGTYEVWVHNGRGGEYGWSRSDTDLTVWGGISFAGGNTIDVTAYGATGDGTTNDAAAIQSAISAAGDWDTIYFPAGTYYTGGSTFSIPANRRLMGDGMDQTVLLSDVNSSYFTIRSQSEAKDLTFEANLTGAAFNHFVVLSGSDIWMTNAASMAWLQTSMSVQGATRVHFNGGRVAGREGIWMGGADHIYVDGVDFYARHDAINSMYSWGGKYISVINSTVQDWDNSDGNDASGWGRGRFYTGTASWGRQEGVYFGNNTTIDLAVREELIWEQNSGEQLLWEASTVYLTDTVTAAGATTIAPGSSNTENRVVVVSGPGVGQVRGIVSYDSGTGLATIDEPWNVVPVVGESVVTVIRGIEKVAIYDNYLDAKDWSAPREKASASVGVQTYEGATQDFVVDNNVMHQVRAGIVIFTATEGGMEGLNKPSYWLYGLNNTFDAVRTGIAVTGSDATAGHGMPVLGLTFRDNVMLSGVASAISVGGNTDEGAPHLLVFDGNQFANVPGGAMISTSTSYNVGTVVLYGNSFDLGTAEFSDSTGITFNPAMTVALRGNTWTGYETIYGANAPGGLPAAPYRAFEATAEDEGVATFALPIWNTGTDALDWTISDDASWLTGSLVVGSVGDQASADLLTMTADAYGMDPGVYSADVTLTGAGETITMSVEFTVSAWANQDVGAPASAGSYTYAGGTYTIEGGGAGIGGTSDQFHYVYRSLDGDGEIIARVSSLENTDAQAAGGVMIRQSLDADSPFALMTLMAGGGTAFLRRGVTGGDTTTTDPGDGVAAPYYVRLVRDDDTISAYKSADGSSWVLVGTDTVTMPTGAYVGLAVTSHDDSTLATGVFDSVEVFDALGEVNVYATDRDAAETGPDTAEFTFYRTLVNGRGDLTVHYTVGGTTDASDYEEPLAGTVVIPAGQQSASITVTPTDDAIAEDVETIVVDVAADAAYTVGGYDTDTATIVDNEPHVTIAATDAAAAEAGTDPMVFTVTRTNGTVGDLTVYYAATGTAVEGSDFPTLTGSVVIPDGQASATVTVTPIDDTEVEKADESVTLTLTGDPAYWVDEPSSDTGWIHDDDFPTVTVSASDNSAAEEGLDPGEFTVTRAGSLVGDLTVYYTTSGLADNGVDYASLTGSVTIPDGSASVAIPVTPFEDDEKEWDETVILTIDEAETYWIGSSDDATVTIYDNDFETMTWTGAGDGVSWSDANNWDKPGGLRDRDTVVLPSSDVDLTTIQDIPDLWLYGLEITQSHAGVTQTVQMNYDVDVDDSDNSTLPLVDVTAGSLVLDVGGNEFTWDTLSSNVFDIQDNMTVILSGGTMRNALRIRSGGTLSGTGTLYGTANFTVESGGVLEVGDDELNFWSVNNSTPSAYLYGALLGTTANSHVEFGKNPYDSSGGGEKWHQIAVGPDTQISGLGELWINGYSDSGFARFDPASEPNIDLANTTYMASGTWVNVEAQTTTADLSAFKYGHLRVEGWKYGNSSPMGFKLVDTGTVDGDFVYTNTMSFQKGEHASDSADYCRIDLNGIPLLTDLSQSTLQAHLADGRFINTGAGGDPTVKSVDFGDTTYWYVAPLEDTIESVPVVELAATDATGSETGPDTGQFTFTRDDAVGDLAVYYTVSGTAAADDYTETLSGSIVIPDGNLSATLDITPVDDSEIENPETVTVTLAAGTGYQIHQTNAQGTVTIADDDVPEVSVTAAGPASEAGDVGEFTVTRSGTGLVTQGDLVVQYTVSGSADNSDYEEVLTGSVVIPDGEASVVLTVTPVADPVVEGDETVTLTATAGSAYTLGAPAGDTVTIADDEPTVTVTATDATGGEDGPDTATFTITRDTTDGDLTVQYTVGGTAAPGDYAETLSGQVTIPDGSSSVDLTVTPVDDGEIEGDETLEITLTPVAGAFGTMINGYPTSVVTATGTAFWPYEGPRTVDGSGFGGAAPDFTDADGDEMPEHDTDEMNMWMSDTSVVDEWISFDLGQAETLGTMRVWNFNQSGQTDRGIRTARIYYSNLADPDEASPNDPAQWTQIPGPGAGGLYTIAEATGTADYDDVSELDLNGAEGRHVLVVVDTNHGDDRYVGLSEVQFIEPDELGYTVGTSGSDTVTIYDNDVPSPAPSSVDLLAGSDTGVSDTDGLTRLDNADAGSVLQFQVSGVIDGAAVQLFAGGVAISDPVTAAGTTVTVTTNGTVDLADGSHTVTARQTEPAGAESADSPGAGVQVDTIAPRVSGFGVSSSSSSWSLGVVDSTVWTGSLERIAPWSVLDRLVVVFDGTVYSDGDLTLSGVNAGAMSVSGPDAAFGSQLTWQVGEYLDTDRYTVAVSAQTDGVTDAAGNRLDGESAQDVYPSGDGTPGGDWSFDLAVLPGDSDADNDVDLTDFNAVRYNWGSGTDYAHGDFNGDGTVGLTDFNAVRYHWGQTVPDPQLLTADPMLSTAELDDATLQEPDSTLQADGGDGELLTTTEAMSVETTTSEPAEASDEGDDVVDVLAQTSRRPVVRHRSPVADKAPRAGDDGLVDVLAVSLGRRL